MMFYNRYNNNGHTRTIQLQPGDASSHPLVSCAWRRQQETAHLRQRARLTARLASSAYARPPTRPAQSKDRHGKLFSPLSGTRTAVSERSNAGHVFLTPCCAPVRGAGAGVSGAARCGLKHPTTLHLTHFGGRRGRSRLGRQAGRQAGRAAWVTPLLACGVWASGLGVGIGGVREGWGERDSSESSGQCVCISRDARCWYSIDSIYMSQ